MKFSIRELLCISWLLVIATTVIASDLVYNTNITSNYTINVSNTTVISYNYTCPACVNISNSTYTEVNLTVPWEKEVSCYSSMIINGSTNLTHSGTTLTGGGFTIHLSNANKTQTIAVDSVDEDYVKVKFWSNYIVPETLVLRMYSKNYSYNVVGNAELYVPIEIDYDAVNWSELYNNAINLSLRYEILSSDYSGTIEFNFRYEQEPEVVLIRDFAQYKVNDLIVEKMIVDTKVPIKEVNVSTSHTAETRVIKSENEIFVYLTPTEVGDYTIEYKLTDYFGNVKTVVSRLNIAPIGTVFFATMNIPSIRIGERSKIKIYSNDVTVPINYTLTLAEFTPTNYSLMRELNLTSETAMDVYLSDSSDNSYFTLLNKTVTITRQETYLNIMPLLFGELTLRYEVQTPNVMKSNSDFIIRATVGNYSVFTKQEFNVAGRLITCELSDTTDLQTATRKCWTEFPIYGNLDNNLIILQKRDYNVYQAQHTGAMMLLEEQKDIIIDNRENWLMIFIFAFTVTFFVLLYVLLPKDWIVLRVKKSR